VDVGHLKRYTDIAWLLIKYGRSDWVKDSFLAEALPEAEKRQSATPTRAEELAGDLEKLGPTFIKLGQMLSTRTDLLPAPYLEALSRLQDDVEPFPFAQVEQILEAELGVRTSKAFSSFNPEPLAAASLGQVHQASLRDGRNVAVKIQRPEIRERIAADLDVLERFATFADGHTRLAKTFEFRKVFQEFKQSLSDELDYRKEAANLAKLGENLKSFERIVVPSPVPDYSTSRVLTMDYVFGKKVTSIGPLTRMEIDGAALSDELFRAYLQQILVDGFFHADPHPGNVFLTDDRRIALLDLGMVGRISPGMQEKLIKLLIAGSEGRSDDVATLAIAMGEKREDFREQDFRRRVDRLVSGLQDATMEQIEVGRIVLEITRAAGEEGIRAPTELTMLGKTLLSLDHISRTLDPHFDPNACIRQNSAAIMQGQLRSRLSVGNAFQSILELKEFLQALPQRMNKILDALVANDLKVKIEMTDRGMILDAAQKIANRITLGLLLASLIIGAALLIRVPSRFQILGYPTLAIFFFLAAAVGALILAFRILFIDERSNREGRK